MTQPIRVPLSWRSPDDPPQATWTGGVVGPLLFITRSPRMVQFGWRMEGWWHMVTQTGKHVAVPPSNVEAWAWPHTAADYDRAKAKQEEPSAADPTIHADDRTLAEAANVVILSALRAAGADGMTNADLACISRRYGARIYDLRQAGHTIRTTRTGRCRYTYPLEAT